MFNRWFILTKVFYKLGFFNIARVVLYRFQLRIGWFEHLTPSKLPIQGHLFTKENVQPKKLPDNLSDWYISKANLFLSGQHNFFFGKKKNVGNPPEWQQSNKLLHERVHWTNTPINTRVGEDVKLSWDLSRFLWMPTFAAAYSVSKDDCYLGAINSWFNDWSNNNPPNTGVNWVCAQEVSIRLINILNAAFLLGLHNSCVSKVFLKVVVVHCKRVYPTIGYAVAQDNNHGISEASALFIAGSWLQAFSKDEKHIKLGVICSRKGSRTLEKLVGKLVLTDGGFSMSSFAYHRVVLDTLSIVEFWRETLNLPKFSDMYYSKATLLVDFLYQMLDRVSGDVPNIGANDGSRSYLLTDSDYRDFRPSLQLSSGYFCDSRVFECDRIDWFSATLPQPTMPQWRQESRLFKHSGFVTLRCEDDESWALVRFPSFHFRPAQSDALHFDLWRKGRNILTDSGSFSYNCSSQDDGYFAGAAGHNVVQFDNRETMPRLGKFLWGEWPKVQRISDMSLWSGEGRWSCSFSDYLGAKHAREVTIGLNSWVINDHLCGVFSQALIRWHLEDSKWNINGNIIESGDVKIIIQANAPISLRLGRGWKSLYYNEKTEIPVLELLVASAPIQITTEILFTK